MSMYDCPKCWETPCVCGYEYRNWTKERIQQQIKMLQKVLNEKSNIKEDDDFSLMNHGE